MRHRALGTEALYRVSAEGEGCVEMEVVQAPGLSAGTLVRFTRHAVENMEVVEEGSLHIRVIG
jgi:hypothetical protein